MEGNDKVERVRDEAEQDEAERDEAGQEYERRKRRKKRKKRMRSNRANHHGHNLNANRVQISPQRTNLQQIVYADHGRDVIGTQDSVSSYGTQGRIESLLFVSDKMGYKVQRERPLNQPDLALYREERTGIFAQKTPKKKKSSRKQRYTPWPEN